MQWCGMVQKPGINYIECPYECAKQKAFWGAAAKEVVAWCCAVGYGTVWYGMVWYGVVWYGMVWYGMVWYGMVWYGMV